MNVSDFRLADWRAGVAKRRELVRLLVLEAVNSATRINVALTRVKQAADFDRLSDKDKNSFNVMASQARAVVSGWKDLDETVRQDFVTGRKPYAALYAMLK